MTGMHETTRLLTLGREALASRPSNLGLSSDSVAYRSHAPVVMIHRDSDALARSNFAVILEALEASHGETVSVHEPDCPHVDDPPCACAPDVLVERFRDWLVGWTEHVLVRVERRGERGELPTMPTDAWRDAVAWSDALADYPVADEEHFSALEHEELTDYVASELDGHDGPWTDAVLTAIYDAGQGSSVEEVDLEEALHTVWSERASEILARGLTFLALRVAGDGQLTLTGDVVTVPAPPTLEEIDNLTGEDGDLPWTYVSRALTGSDAWEELEELRDALAGVLAVA